MKLVFAAPASGLPSALTALVAQLSAMHFFMNEVFAAPASGLPSLPTALVSQDSCAAAEPSANAVMIAAKKIRFIVGSSLSQDKRLDWTLESRRDQAPIPDIIDKMPNIAGPLSEIRSR